MEVGDKVEKGQTLAKINTNSVLAAMYEVQAKMDAIEDKLYGSSGSGSSGNATLPDPQTIISMMTGTTTP